MMAAASSMPFSMPSLVKSSARLSYHTFATRAAISKSATKSVMAAADSSGQQKAREVQHQADYLETKLLQFQI